MTTLTDLQRAVAARANHNGTLILTRPTPRWPFMTWPRADEVTTGRATETAASSSSDAWGTVLVAAASLLLLSLALAMGVVSWHAQYAFIFGIKHQKLASALEALGLDAGAVVFSILGIALARLGRRAVIERVLVCACAAGSLAMNAAGADLGSPRSVAAFAMPPILFAVVSDRLTALIRRTALGPAGSEESQGSAWRTAGVGFLYLLRLVIAPPSTLRGARQAILNVTPLPELPAPSKPAAIEPPGRSATASPGPSGRRRRNRRPGATKTQRFLNLVAQRHGPLATFPLTDVSRVATSIAPEVGLHPGSARTALKAAVTAARNGQGQ